MSFSKADAAINNKRIINPPGIVGHRLTSGMRQLISLPTTKLSKVYFGLRPKRLTEGNYFIAIQYPFFF